MADEPDLDEGDPRIDLLRTVAGRMDAGHAGNAGNGVWGRQTRLVGLVAEAEFSRTFHVPMDFTVRPNGDIGWDFVLPLAYRVDVTASRNPIHLLGEIGKLEADIYVLAGYVEETGWAKLLGWEWRKKLSQARVMPVKPKNILHHAIPAEELRGMDELESRQMRLSSKFDQE
jgi:hypothetical protein